MDTALKSTLNPVAAISGRIQKYFSFVVWLHLLEYGAYDDFSYVWPRYLRHCVENFCAVSANASAASRAVRTL
jgi:hypothetical protein